MAEKQRLGQMFIGLADTLVSEFDVVDFLTTLADHCVEVLGATQAGVLLADNGSGLRSVASSSEAAHLLELFEIQNQEGPCLDCFRTGQQVLNCDGETQRQRWPRFAGEAHSAGFSMVHALPMRLRGEVIGAVNVFGEETTPLTETQVGLGQALADVATIGLLQERGLREARLLNEQLQAALTSRVVIEQAKGILSERAGIDMDESFSRLRVHARRTNHRLGSIAQALIDGSLDASEVSHP